MTTVRALVMGAGAALALTGSSGAATPEYRACAATLVPDQLTLSSRPVRVLAEAPRPLGELEQVRPSPASGIEVLGVERDRPPGSAWVLELDLREASAGDWELELQGTDENCVGRLELREAGDG